MGRSALDGAGLPKKATMLSSSVVGTVSWESIMWRISPNSSSSSARKPGLSAANQVHSCRQNSVQEVVAAFGKKSRIGVAEFKEKKAAAHAYAVGISGMT